MSDLKKFCIGACVLAGVGAAYVLADFINMFLALGRPEVSRPPWPEFYEDRVAHKISLDGMNYKVSDHFVRSTWPALYEWQAAFEVSDTTLRSLVKRCVHPMKQELPNKYVYQQGDIHFSLTEVGPRQFVAYYSF